MCISENSVFLFLSLHFMNIIKTDISSFRPSSSDYASVKWFKSIILAFKPCDSQEFCLEHLGPVYWENEWQGLLC
jgi:hypothetical protein